MIVGWIVGALKVLVHAFFIMAVGLLFMGLGRRFTAKFQRRYGPPVWQTYLDVVKCFARKSISHHYIMDLGSVMGLAGLIAAAMFLPVGRYLAVPSTGPILVILPSSYSAWSLCSIPRHWCVSLSSSREVW